MNYILGIDTSCYTTSAALVDLQGKVILNKQIPLKVKRGERGLRQSEALFQHLHHLPLISKEVRKVADLQDIVGLCASVKPRPVAGSYMPVFMVSRLVGEFLGDMMDIPFYEVSHQENHIMAGRFSANGPRSSRFLAVHLSGGTSELLRVVDNGTGYDIEILGATLDLHAGQFVDRVGVAMGLPFPAGPALEELAAGAKEEMVIPSSVKNLSISFSGAETCARRFLEMGAPREAVALGVFRCLVRTLEKWIYSATRKVAEREILMVGGVSSSKILRTELSERLRKRDENIRLYFAESVLSKDNAVGTALLGLRYYKSLKGGKNESKDN